MYEELFYQYQLQGKNTKPKRACFILIETGQRYIMGAFPNGYIGLQHAHYGASQGGV
ncbi:hypothetical protein [Neisseria sicca]